MSITQILVFVFGIIKISSIGCDYIVNPETKDNRFYREDSYVYVEDKSENVKSRSLSKQGEKRLGSFCSLRILSYLKILWFKIV